MEWQFFFDSVSQLSREFPQLKYRVYNEQNAWKEEREEKKLGIKNILRIQMSNIQNITKQIKFEKTTTTTTKYSLVKLTCLH